MASILPNIVAKNWYLTCPNLWPSTALDCFEPKIAIFYTRPQHTYFTSDRLKLAHLESQNAQKALKWFRSLLQLVIATSKL